MSIDLSRTSAVGLATWTERVRDVHGDLDIEGDVDFVGSIAGRASTDFAVTRCASSPVRITRVAAQGQSDSREAIEIKLIRQGSCTIAAQGRRRTFDRGSLLLYRLHEPAMVEHSEGFEATYLTILHPTGQLMRPRAWRELTGAPAIGSQTLNALADRADELSAREFRATCSLLAGLFTGGDSGDPSEPPLLDRVLNHVALHCGDASLTTARIARDLGWSPRRIQTEVQRAGTTVSALIRSERLERARSALVDPSATQSSIASVGRDHGFTNGSAFAASFRRYFGESPSEARKRALS